MEIILNKDDLVKSVLNDWWYYSVELSPGIITKGMDTPRTPMIPRMMMRNCNLQGMDCLDIGSMEGLIPTAMVRKGAKSVLATDAIPHCKKKMDVVREIYDVNFDFREIGLLYDMSTKLHDKGGFDLINLSGVLYHVFSPMHVLAGIRPLLKRNGLMIISTNVINKDGCTLDYNSKGSLQMENNTFWYHSVPMLEQLIRFFKMVPIDFLFCPHTDVNPYNYVPGLNSGYMSVVCRAVDDKEINDGDMWAAASRASSWEFLSLCNGEMLNKQHQSTITYENLTDESLGNENGIDLMSNMNDQRRIVSSVSDPINSQLLRLTDYS